MSESRWSRPAFARLAVVEEKVDDLEEEVKLHRDRLHKLEGTQAAFLGLAENVAQLPAKMEAMARRAALDALELDEEKRNERGHRRWVLRFQWIGAGVGAGGLVIAILFHFF